MYPVERRVSETGEPFHKQQLFLLLGVHIRRENDLRMMYSVPGSFPGSFPWEHTWALSSHSCCTPEPLAFNIPVLCCHIGMEALPEWCFVIKCHTVDSMITEVFPARTMLGFCVHIPPAHLQRPLWSTPGSSRL